MTPAELRQRLKQTRGALRARVLAARDEQAAALGKNPHVIRARRRRRLQRAVLAIAVLLLLLLIRCDETGSGSPVSAAVPDAGVEPVVKKPPATSPAKPFRPVVKASPVLRPAFDTPAKLPNPWVDAFRLQVAARSPRLATCFNGSARPGAVRWTTLVSKKDGAVGTHEFEAMVAGVQLDAAQTACLTEALERPGYRIAAGDGDGLPERVSLVLEF